SASHSPRGNSPCPRCEISMQRHSDTACPRPICSESSLVGTCYRTPARQHARAPPVADPPRCTPSPDSESGSPTRSPHFARPNTTTVGNPGCSTVRTKRTAPQHRSLWPVDDTPEDRTPADTAPHRTTLPLFPLDTALLPGAHL